MSNERIFQRRGVRWLPVVNATGLLGVPGTTPEEIPAFAAMKIVINPARYEPTVPTDRDGQVVIHVAKPDSDDEYSQDPYSLIFNGESAIPIFEPDGKTRATGLGTLDFPCICLMPENEPQANAAEGSQDPTDPGAAQEHGWAGVGPIADKWGLYSSGDAYRVIALFKAAGMQCAYVMPRPTTAPLPSILNGDSGTQALTTGDLVKLGNYTTATGPPVVAGG